MTTESLMVHALKRGLLIADFHELSIGMILDYINRHDYLCNDQSNHEKVEIMAKQNEFDIF